VEEAIAAVGDRAGSPPQIITTTARTSAKTSTYGEVSSDLEARPGLILFGTGHGLAASELDRADHVLAPIEPASDYNHLSVRAAVAITLDRLFGTFD